MPSEDYRLKMLQFNHQQFRAVAAIILGGILATLIVAPFALSDPESAKPWLFLIAAPLGLLIGFRRRHSVAFLYFSMIATLILASILSARMSY